VLERGVWDLWTGQLGDGSVESRENVSWFEETHVPGYVQEMTGLARTYYFGSKIMLKECPMPGAAGAVSGVGR